MKKNKDRDVIEKFMRERDLPDWFRGLSKFQREAADSLLNSIRDDCEQATSHRVRDALRRIGIEPLVGPSKIKFVMYLSGGNDIAFLWFLMEMYYRSDQCAYSKRKYSVNEQIFVTVIAYLDTIPTLRELDKLLPKKPERNKKATKTSLRKKKIRSDIIFPYFQKQKRPILYGKNLTLNEVHNIANFSEFENYRNASYIVFNESNRWFANYELKRCERIAKSIIRNQIDTIFEAKLDEHHHEGHSLNLCSHHKNIQAIKETLANELKVAERKACEKYFDVNGHFRNESHKRVIKDLNTEISKASKELKIDNQPQEQISLEPHDENQNLYNFGHDATLNSKCIYFKGPSSNKPYKFNYHKIFDLGARNPIKDAIASALNADSSGNISLQHSRAIRKCCKEIWTQEVKSYNLNYKIKKKSNPHKKEAESKFNNGVIENYDPRNKNLMQSMLFKALQEIKKNKKFVLASLPDAHKFPTLREWIKKRYGMVYTRQEKRKAFKRTKKVFQVLRNNALRVRIPHLNDLSKNRIVSYGCKEYLLKKTNYLKEIYQHKFKESLLEDTRIYWAAVRPYQCSKGPPRNEFFSYLPARKNDVHMFRPWKIREYIHAKEEWDRRQRIQKADISY